MIREHKDWGAKYPLGPIRFDYVCDWCGKEALDQPLFNSQANQAAATGIPSRASNEEVCLDCFAFDGFSGHCSPETALSNFLKHELCK